MQLEHPINISFDEEEKLFDWLESESNPLLWAELLVCINYDMEISWKLVHWIVKKPECDIGTAVLALGIIAGYQEIYSTADEFNNGNNDNSRFAIAKTICENSENGFYTANRVGELPFEWSQLAIKQAIEKTVLEYGGDLPKPQMPIPTSILNAELPVTPMPASEYLIDESGIYHLDNFDEDFKKLMMGID